VPEFCTCGAKLPEDARFCHKCGKPQRDEPVFVEQETVPPPLPPTAPKIPPIGLTNGLAVRIALLGGALSLALSVVSGQILAPGVSLIWLVAAGFVCVLLYRKRTGQKLSVIHGAHLGWICGLFVFTIVVVMFAVNILSDPAEFQNLVDSMRDRLNTSAPPGLDVNRAIELMRSPVGILFELLVMFVLLTLPPAFGGAIGAKLLDRE
jgi:hypothetical protein